MPFDPSRVGLIPFERVNGTARTQQRTRLRDHVLDDGVIVHHIGNQVRSGAIVGDIPGPDTRRDHHNRCDTTANDRVCMRQGDLDGAVLHRFDGQQGVECTAVEGGSERTRRIERISVVDVHAAQLGNGDVDGCTQIPIDRADPQLDLHIAQIRVFRRRDCDTGNKGDFVEGLCIPDIWRGGDGDTELRRWGSRHCAPIRYTYDVMIHCIT